MLYRLCHDIAETLTAKGYPFFLTYGTTVAPVESYGVASIAVARDRNRGDTIAAPIGPGGNPSNRFTRHVGAHVIIRASSSVSGAMTHDHEEECYRFANAFLIALYQWCKANGTLQPVITESRTMQPGELDQSQSTDPNCVAHSIRFSIATAVRDVDYDGSAAPVGGAATLATTSRATQDGGNYEDI